MADIPVTPSASYTVAADDIGGVGYQRIKIDVGVSGVTSGDVGATNPLPVTGSVAISGTGLMSVVPGVSVTIQQGVSVSAVVSGTVTVNGSVSVSGTGLVSVVPGVSVIAQVSGTVTVAPTTFTVNTAAAATTVVSGTVTVNGSVSVSGTGLVSVVPGVSVVAQVSGTVTAGAANPTTAAPSISATGDIVWAIPADRTSATPGAAATGQIVWVANPGAAVATTVLTVQTILGTAVVSVVPGLSVSAVVSGTVTAVNADLLFTIGMPTQASTAQIVVAKPAPMNYIGIYVTSTAVAVSANKYLFTIFTGATGAPAAAGTTSWAVPAGKVLRLSVLQAAITSSAVLGGSVRVFVGVGATASMVSASIATQLQLLRLQLFGAAALQSAALFGCGADVTAGESICVFIQASTAVILRDLTICGNCF